MILTVTEDLAISYMDLVKSCVCAAINLIQSRIWLNQIGACSRLTCLFRKKLISYVKRLPKKLLENFIYQR